MVLLPHNCLWIVDIRVFTLGEVVQILIWFGCANEFDVFVAIAVAVVMSPLWHSTPYMRQFRIRVFVVIFSIIICIILGVAVGILGWITNGAVCENFVSLFTAIVLVRVLIVAVV